MPSSGMRFESGAPTTSSMVRKPLPPGLLDRVEGDDVRVVQRRDRPGLVLEPHPALGVVGHVRREDLERDLPAQVASPSPGRPPPSSGPEGTGDFVGTEAGAGSSGMSNLDRRVEQVHHRSLCSALSRSASLAKSGGRDL